MGNDEERPSKSEIHSWHDTEKNNQKCFIFKESMSLFFSFLFSSFSVSPSTISTLDLDETAL